MDQYCALVFDGISQHWVRLQASSEQECLRQLAATFAVFVCIWMGTESVVDS